MTAKELIAKAEKFINEMRDHYDDSDELDNCHCECVSEASVALIEALESISLAVKG